MIEHVRDLRVYRQAFEASGEIFDLSKSWLDAALDCEYIAYQKHEQLDQKYDHIIGGLVKMMNQSQKWCSSMVRESHSGYQFDDQQTDASSSDASYAQETTPPESTILDKIVGDTREVIARRKRERPAGELEQMPGFDREPLDFAEALRSKSLSVITEIKKASPSKGVIRPGDFNVARIAADYAENGAAALSVLTEPLHFQGKPDYLAQARRAADVPILRKDFIVDPYQLVEARAYGADAVLLIAAVLDADQLYDLHQAADELGLACLVEVYDASELDRIDFDQISVIGVNNRDLRTFEVDLDHAPRVLKDTPPGLVTVAESGLKTADDLKHVRDAGIDAVLVGETLMRADQPGEKLKRIS
jgi:indole-3-glycerol phosphate synthase